MNFVLFRIQKNPGLMYSDFAGLPKKRRLAWTKIGFAIFLTKLPSPLFSLRRMCARIPSS